MTKTERTICGRLNSSKEFWELDINKKYYNGLEMDYEPEDNASYEQGYITGIRSTLELFGYHTYLRNGKFIARRKA